MAKQAIEGKRENAFARDPKTLVIVGYDTNEGAEVSGYDERVKIIDSTITPEWVANIRKLGVIEPVVVRKDGPRVVVVDGRRRVLGARKANEQRAAAGEEPILVTCIVRKGGDKDAFDAMVASNMGRVDDPPTILAQKMARAITLHKATEHDLAITFHMTPAQVKRHLALLELSDKVQALVTERKLAAGAALTLLDLPRTEQEAKAKELVEAGAGTAEAQRQLKLRKKPEGQKKASKRQDDEESEDTEREVRGKRPGVAELRKLESNEDFVASLSEDARHLLHWVCGNENSARRVKGLTAALRG